MSVPSSTATPGCGREFSDKAGSLEHSEEWLPCCSASGEGKADFREFPGLLRVQIRTVFR
jgi:hypothetical protein